jgi:TatD DNase family protein
VIDFHCHLDLFPNPAAIAQECQIRGVYVLSVTTVPSAWEGTNALALGKMRIRTALGLHPQLAHEREPELAMFEKLLPKAPYVGEVGLDGAPEFRAHWNIQVRVFTRVLELCESAGGRVLSIHSRRAAGQVLDSLQMHPDAGVPVLHWFSGTQRELKRAIDLGCWFSVGPAMLLSERGRSLVAMMPRERVLTETDAPFAQFEGRAALPWDAVTAATLLERFWGKPTDVARILGDNLRRLGELAATSPP